MTTEKKFKHHLVKIYCYVKCIFILGYNLLDASKTLYHSLCLSCQKGNYRKIQQFIIRSFVFSRLQECIKLKLRKEKWYVGIVIFSGHFSLPTSTRMQLEDIDRYIDRIFLFSGRILLEVTKTAAKGLLIWDKNLHRLLISIWKLNKCISHTQEK